MINPMQVMNMVSMLQNNPMGMLSRNGFNVPANLNNPQQIANHLVQTGQINQDTINQAMQIARQMGIKI